MSSRELLFSIYEQDGLIYIKPLPAHHPVYRWREFIRSIGRMIDRVLFPGLHLPKD
jgi:hypothetical protein